MVDENDNNSRPACIDREMIPSKIVYFLADGYFGSILPFMNAFYVSLGLSATRAGRISGISLAVSSIFNPLWSTVADATGYRKQILIIMCLGTGSTVFAMPWVAKAVGSHSRNSTCMDNRTINETHPCNYSSSTYLLDTDILFYTLMAHNIVAWIFFTSLRSYVDGIVTNVTNTRTTKRNYGIQKAFGCIGYSFFNTITGVIADHYNPTDTSPYSAMFYVFLPCVLFLIPAGLILLNQAKWGESNVNLNTSNVYRQLISLFKNLDFLVFLLSVTIAGFLLNVFICFFVLFMEYEMNSTKTLTVSAVALGIAFELITFVFASKFVSICGTIPSLIIGIFSFFPRFMLMSYIVNPYYVLAIQPLHGLGMGLAWAAIVEHTYDCSRRYQDDCNSSNV